MSARKRKSPSFVRFLKPRKASEAILALLASRRFWRSSMVSVARALVFIEALLASTRTGAFLLFQ